MAMRAWSLKCHGAASQKTWEVIGENILYTYDPKENSKYAAAAKTIQVGVAAKIVSKTV
jgi:hypothetical protein